MTAQEGRQPDPATPGATRRVAGETGAGALHRRITAIPDPGPEAARAEDDLADLLRLDDPAAEPLSALLDENADARRLVVGATANAPYLRDLIRGRPALLLACLDAAPETVMDELLAQLATSVPASEAETMVLVRRAKRQAALLIALADLGGVWDLMTVTRALTRLADACVSAAIRFLLAEAAGQGRYLPPDPADPETGSGLVVLAMGKQGAGELNYSSDIDLIVFYDGDKAPLAAGTDVATFFVRLIRRMVRILQDRTADGYAFRTDLRLRPDPGATAVAISLSAAFLYYESIGQNWERAALIKARPCAGDRAVGEMFLREIRPFIWRKYLDYAAIRDIHSIKRQIHAVKGHGRIAIAGHNLKLGRGGIREIEFFVQTQQLIAGGRLPELRGRETLAMLGALQALGWVDAKARAEMEEAYIFLRRVEHRIQMVNDEQTHALPEAPEALARVARLSGFSDVETFGAAVIERLQRVSRHYADLFDQETSLSGEIGNMVFTGDEDDPGTLDTLRRLGFAQAEDVTRAVRAWHFGRYPATRSIKAREILTELTPKLIEALARTEAADQAFRSFDAFLGRLPTGVQLFSILSANPNLLDLLATIMGAAPRLAEIVARRPHVMDAVLEPAFFGEIPADDEVARRLAGTLAEARSYEEALDRIRIFTKEQQFLIGVRLISGALPLRRAGEAYTRLADAILDQLLERVVAEFERSHGRVAGGALVVVAMGKLGGAEMTATSDLDLILLYDHADDAEASDGARPLAPTQYFTRLTQRLVAALTSPTAEGKLYEVDFRLRPSGNAGPLATRVTAFERYQESEAWTWEHMALTRARVVAGDEALAARVEAIIAKTLRRPREAAAIRTDVADMRARVEQELGSRDPWDLKRVAGGVFDAEFIAQTLQLVHGSTAGEIVRPGTEAALQAAAEAGLLDVAAAETLLPALRLYADLTQIVRLTVGGTFDPATATRGLARLVAAAAEMPDLSSLEARLVDTEAAVRATFERLIGRVERRKEA